MNKVVCILLIILLCPLLMWAEGNKETVKKNCAEVKLHETEVKLSADTGVLFEIFSITSETECIYAADVGGKKGLEYIVKGKSQIIMGYDVNEINWNEVFFPADNEIHKIVATSEDKTDERSIVKIGDLYPIINLDLYSKDEDCKKIPIPNDSIIEVTVDYSKLVDDKNKKILKDQEKIILYFYTETEAETNVKSNWVPIESAIKDPKSIIRDGNGNVIKFQINSWPINDRWISCGP